MPDKTNNGKLEKTLLSSVNASFTSYNVRKGKATI